MKLSSGAERSGVEGSREITARFSYRIPGLARNTELMKIV